MQNLVTIPNKIRVAHISGYYPPHLGGMEKVIESIVNLQAVQGIDVQVITSNLGITKTKIKDPVPVKRLRGFEIAHTPLVPSLLRVLLSLKPGTIFHVHVSQSLIPEISLFAAKILKSKIIMHIHSDMETSGITGFLVKPYKNLFLKYTLRHSDAVIVPTKVFKDYISDKYAIKEKLFVVSGGVDQDFFKTKPKKIIVGTPLELLYVGRLSIEKNVLLLINALELLRFPAVLTIVGDGYMKSNILLRISLIKDNMHKIIMVGQKSREQVIEYYKRADIVLLASDYESQSLVALEAMATGTPIIFAPLPAVKSIVMNSGIQADKTAQSFAQIITSLTNDKDLLIKLGSNGQLRAKKFTWDKSVLKLKKIYLNL